MQLLVNLLFMSDHVQSDMERKKREKKSADPKRLTHDAVTCCTAFTADTCWDSEDQ